MAAIAPMHCLYYTIISEKKTPHFSGQILILQNVARYANYVIQNYVIYVIQILESKSEIMKVKRVK